MFKESAFRMILIEDAVAEPDKQPDQSLCNHSRIAQLGVYRHIKKDNISAAKTLTRRVIYHRRIISYHMSTSSISIILEAWFKLGAWKVTPGTY